ncbi:MAG TPA: SDR family NAD(P)-dependent oxidoreductase [Planctomycetota bacterium]|nr:SDR family NAD(P)-dependent oxidoreductase [Planctomycetota bacterium]
MHVIVTGASRGIGAGIARVLGRAGLSVGLLARDRAALETIAAEIRAGGGSAELEACDLRDPDATFDAIEQLVVRLGGVDALVNNAGLVIRKSVLDLSVDEWRDMLATNVSGVFYATRAVLPRLRAQGSGHIINVSSISGRWPLAGGSGYAASKFAVTGFSQSLFQEVRDWGIKVTTIYPGSVATERHGDDERASTWKLRPEEVGEAVRDLLRTGPGNCISEVEIRPLRRPPR